MITKKKASIIESKLSRLSNELCEPNEHILLLQLVLRKLIEEHTTVISDVTEYEGKPSMKSKLYIPEWFDFISIFPVKTVESKLTICERRREKLINLQKRLREKIQTVIRTKMTSKDVQYKRLSRCTS